MRGLKIDEKNNLVINQNSLVMVEGVNKASQDVKTTLGLHRGENPFNVRDGIDWEGQVLGKASEDSVKSIVASRIQQNEEVFNVLEVKFDKQKDNVIIETKVNTVYGVVDV